MTDSKWYEGSWFETETVHDLLMSERQVAARQMADDIEQGNEGIASSAVWKELDMIIRRLNAKKPATVTPVTDSSSASKQN